MSRIGKIPIVIPKEVKSTIQPTAIQLEGPKGKLSINLPRGILAESKDGKILLTRTADTKQDRANHGTTSAHLRNLVVGVTKGHHRNLEIQGVGFKTQLKGNKLVFNVGFSHQVEYDVPKEVKVTSTEPTVIILESMDKGILGQVASQIRHLKPPEPYKGKGIRYSGQVVKRKQGKSVTK